jgi:hypothetical protein
MLDVRIKMRSSHYAASPQDADTGRGSQEFLGAVQYSGSGRPEFDVRTSRFEPLSHVQGPPGRPVSSLRLQRPLGGFEELDCIVPQGRQRNGGLSRVRIRGVSMPPCTLQSITFLSQTPDQPGQLSVTVIWCLDKPHT